MSWRRYLATLVRTPGERKELAKKIGIAPRTLDRWVSGEAKNPQDYWLQKLLDALPAQRSHLAALLKEEFPHFEPALVPVDEAVKEIPIAFYARVLEANAQIADPLHFWTMVSLILQQMVYQLDPKKVGLQLTIACCVPPRSPDLPVRSLVERVEQGTAPWKNSMGTKRGLFLGSESLAGYVAASGQPAWVQDIEKEQHLFPIRQERYEVSAAAYPIQRKGLIAGVLLAASTQRDFFNETRLKLLHHYTNMVMLAFDRDQFYPRERIRLHPFSTSVSQEALFAQFAARLLAQRQKEPGQSQDRLEIQVYQQLEAEWIAQEVPHAD